VGRPTVIIGYELYDARNDKRLGCACDSNCNDDCDMVFLQTFGVLTNVEQSNSDDAQPNDITLSITIFDFWRELDNYTWEWSSNNPTPLFKESTFGPLVEDEEINYVPEECENYFSDFPSCEEMFGCAICGSFKYRDWANENLYYDEFFWYDQYNIGSCAKRRGGQSEIGISTLSKWYMVNSNSGRWNAPPLSVYSISGLPNSGTFTINVEKHDGLGISKKESTINLDTLDTELASDGYIGLDVADRIIVGDIRRNVNNTFYRPSFIERNGVVLSTKPVWSYDDWTPGLLGLNYSRLAFNYSGSGITTSINAAYIHHFRRV
jgi:hypothetical protein